jgi:hypothetical protein
MGQMEKKFKIAIVIVLIIILICSGLFYFVTQKQDRDEDVLTIEEFYEPMIWNDTYYKKYPLGTEFVVGGTVTDVNVGETSYGDLSEIVFDDYEVGFYLWGNKSRDYRIGKYYEISTITKEYIFNGHTYVWPDRSHYPIGHLRNIISIHKSSTYFDSEWGFFEYPDISISTTRFIVWQAGNQNKTYDSVSISLRRFTGEFGRCDLNYTLYPEIDHMTSLSETTSINNYITFTDSDNSGNYTTGDIVTLTIPPTESESIIDTYFLVIENSKIVVINWFQGCFYMQWPEFSEIIDQ